MLQQPQLAFSCTVLKIQGESSHIHVANVYARDNQFNIPDLQHLLDTYNNLVLADDLNAKHHLILPHTQKTKYNSNGKQLHMFLDGLDGHFSMPAEVTVNNDRSIEAWTHITECGSQVQIDYIISSSNISHLFVDPTYEVNLPFTIRASLSEYPFFSQNSTHPPRPDSSWTGPPLTPGTTTLSRNEK